MRQQTRSPLGYAILTAVIVLSLTLAVMPASAQNVPPAARQAATSPRYANRLAPAKAVGKSVRPLAARKKTASPQDSGVLFDNGPVNGSVDAWTINFGYVVSDSFTLSSSSTVQGFQFFVWLFPGDIPSTVDWSITSQPNGGTLYGSGTANLTDAFLFANGFGFNVDQETASFLANVPLDAGTYFLNLTNAQVPSGDPVFWDENSGVGCGGDNGSGGACPSQAYESAVGTIPSEGFQIYGTSNLNSFPPGSSLEFVTKGDDGTSMVPQEFTYNSAPCPRVQARVDSFVVNREGNANLTISGVVTDEASDLVDPDSGQQVQTLQVNLERTSLGDPIPLVNTATPELPWKPYKFRAPFSTAVTFQANSVGTLEVNLTTSENVAGCSSTATLYVNALEEDQPDVLPQADTDPGTFLPTILRISIPSGYQLQPPYPQITAFGQDWDIAEDYTDGYWYAVDAQGNKVVFLPAVYAAGYQQVQKVGATFSAAVAAPGGPAAAVPAKTGLVVNEDVSDLWKSLKNYQPEKFQQGTKQVFIFSPANGFDHSDNLLVTEILWRYVRTKDTVVRFPDKASLKRDIAFREAVVAATRNVKFSFGASTRFNPDYWTGLIVNAGGEAKGSASAAVADIFDTTHKDKYRMACLLGAMSVQLQGAAQAWGKDKFDSQVKSMPHALYWRVTQKSKQPDAATWVPGDWGYIANGDPLKTIQDQHPDNWGLVVGENVIYVGGPDKGDGKFYGNFSTTAADFKKTAYFWGHLGGGPPNDTKKFAAWAEQVESWSNDKTPAVVKDGRTGLRQPFFVTGAVVSSVKLTPKQFAGGTITIGGKDYKVISNSEDVIWTTTYPELDIRVCEVLGESCRVQSTGTFSFFVSDKEDSSFSYLTFSMRSGRYDNGKGKVIIGDTKYPVKSNALGNVVTREKVEIPFKLTDTSKNTQDGSAKIITPQ